ncbi:hypothetical protein L208DRAFT_1381539 [Tricholoma matsutake]|nr:hypothetical protein L208DRAFT_1381539 [Tricholoma matsutake 945]
MSTNKVSAAISPAKALVAEQRITAVNAVCLWSNEIIEASTPTKKKQIGLVLATMDAITASGTPPVFSSQYSVTSSGAVVKEHVSEMNDKQSVTHPECLKIKTKKAHESSLAKCKSKLKEPVQSALEAPLAPSLMAPSVGHVSNKSGAKVVRAVTPELTDSEWPATPL